MTMLAESMLVGVEVSFHFADGVNDARLLSIKKKVERTAVKLGYTTNAVFFCDHYNVRAVIGIEVTDFNPYKTYDELRKPFQRLIDSHDDDATYGFSH